MNWGKRLCVGIAFFSVFTAARADEEIKTPTLDGVTVDAVESYKNPRNLELGIGGGIFPFDPYYMGFSLNAGLTYYFSTSFAWEIVGGSYAFSVEKGLTSQLADRYGVNPDVIEKLEYAVATNLILIPTYGKAVIFKSFLQHFRSSFLLGGGLIKTSLSSFPAISVAYRSDVYVSDAFSWRLEVRDYFASGGKQFLSFNLGTTVSF